LGVLRLLLAVCVFCSHSTQIADLYWLDGSLAVELFFVISGFYIQLVLSTKYTPIKLGKKWRYKFYLARYTRLIPTYLLGFTLTLALALALGTKDSHLLSVWAYSVHLVNDFGNVLFKTYLILTNFTLFFQDIIMFLSSENGFIHWTVNFHDTDAYLWQGMALRQAWSLGIELSFYLVAPFLLRFKSIVLVMIVTICLISKFSIINYFGLGDPWTYRFFPFELGYFLIGSLSYRFTDSFTRFYQIRRGVLPAMIVYAIVIYFTTSRGYFRGEAIFYPLALGILLPLIFRMTDGSRIDRFIGDFSYPFYIMHLLAFSLAGLTVRRFSITSADFQTWLALILTIFLSYIALMLELRFVEAWRARLGRPGNSTPSQAEGLSGSTLSPRSPY